MISFHLTTTGLMRPTQGLTQSTSHEKLEAKDCWLGGSSFQETMMLRLTGRVNPTDPFFAQGNSPGRQLVTTDTVPGL